jgi:T5SS/PEP-CTERM-associated repeat protein
MGFSSGSSGQVTVDGDSSTWTNFSILYIGREGPGTLNITGGGKVSNSHGYMGCSSGSSGQVTVDGAGSMWDSSGSVYVGGDQSGAGGTGTLTVRNSGQVGVGGTMTVWDAGTVNLEGGQTTTGSFVKKPGGTFNFIGGTLHIDGGTFNPDSNYYTVDGPQNPTLSFANGADAALDQLTVGPNGTLSLATGTATINRISLDGQLKAAGTVQSKVTGSPGSVITAIGTLTLGDAAAADGYNHQGTLVVGSETVTLNSLGMSSPGALTTLQSGTLMMPNGLALATGSNVQGYGTVSGRIASGLGSTIRANGGNLTLGDGNSYAGFTSDGELYTGANTVVINDKNEAVLGSLTDLGTDTADGRLEAGGAQPSDPYHFLVEQGKNVVGRGEVLGHFKNHGHVIGDSPTAPIVFKSPYAQPFIVSGKGTFDNVVIEGTFAPGESPGISYTKDIVLLGAVEMELGGLTPGFGDGYHDQVVDSGLVTLGPASLLEILTWDGYTPNIGDQFVIMTWATGLQGTFFDVTVDPFFLNQNLTFALNYSNPGGAGNLTLTTQPIPEPATILLLAAGLGGLIATQIRRRRRRRAD